MLEKIQYETINLDIEEKTDGSMTERLNLVHVNNMSYLPDTIRLKNYLLTRDEKLETKRMWEKIENHKTGTVITAHPTILQYNTAQCYNKLTTELCLPPVGFISILTVNDVYTHNANSTHSSVVSCKNYIAFSFGVLHDFRRQRIFRDMVNKAYSVMKGFNSYEEGKARVSKLRFCIDTNNYTAISILKKLGFSILSTTSVNLKTKRELLYMAIVSE